VYMHNPSHKSALWTKSLGSSAINAFDVFRPSYEESNAFVEPPSLVLIRQPLSPYLQNRRENEITTFLNTTEEGSWYALSTDRYPLLTSRLKPAAWVDGTENEDRNVTKEALIGMHPVARQQPVNYNPTLPQPSTRRLIEGGDWQNKREEKINTIKENPVFFLAAFIVFVWLLWKRKSLTTSNLLRKKAPVKVIEKPTEEVEITPEPIISIPNGNAIEITPEDKKTDGNKTEDPRETQESEEANPSIEKKPRRKRGQRGGKNNRKKVGFVEPVTDVDDDAAEGENGFVHVSHPKPSPELSVNDQGHRVIDGLIVTDKLLGSGSQGTFVYEGIWDGRSVAVKRMQIENFDLAGKEIDHLRESDEHPNIVRYYTNKRNDKFIYIALELCPATLEQVIVHGNKEPFSQLAGPNLQKQYALSQIAAGLQFLHSLKIVHRDLKPQNILVAPPKVRSTLAESPFWTHYNQNQSRCLISDFGLCKKLEPDHSTFQAQSAMAAGTSGWRAPEVLRGVESEKRGSKDSSTAASDTTSGPDRRITRAVDIFSMGCLFYYVLTDGEHPFGNVTYLRDGRILDNRSDLSSLDLSTNDGVEAYDLISRMISPNPSDRYPSIKFY
jgi:serine/threonine-protein kinase/endoribonuclease IRE1